MNLGRRSFLAAGASVAFVRPSFGQSGRTLQANPGNLAAVLSSTMPGDTVILADGAYGGGKLTIGCTDVRIVAANPLKARFSGDIALVGSGTTLEGIDATRTDIAGGTSVTVGGKGNQLLRSRAFRRIGHCIDLIGQGCAVRYCDVSVWGRMETPMLNGRLMSSSTDFGLIHDPSAKGRGNVVEGCHFHDGPLKVPGNYHHYGITGVGVGINPSQFATESGLVIRGNLFENTGDCEISIKTSKNRIVGNTIAGSRINKAYGNQRSGNYNEWLSNWFDPTAYGMSLVVHGGYHKVIKNYLGQKAMLRHGNFEWNAKPAGETRNHRAYAAHVAENIGTVQYGHRYSGETALKLPPTLCEFSNQKWTAGGGTNARVVVVPHDDIPAAVRLTAADVGPMAGVAP